MVLLAVLFAACGSARREVARIGNSSPLGGFMDEPVDGWFLFDANTPVALRTQYAETISWDEDTAFELVHRGSLEADRGFPNTRRGGKLLSFEHVLRGPDRQNRGRRDRNGHHSRRLLPGASAKQAWREVMQVLPPHLPLVRTGALDPDMPHARCVQRLMQGRGSRREAVPVPQPIQRRSSFLFTVSESANTPSYDVFASKLRLPPLNEPMLAN